MFNCWTLKSLDATQSKSFTRITIGIFGAIIYSFINKLYQNPSNPGTFFNREAIDLMS